MLPLLGLGTASAAAAGVAGLVGLFSYNHGNWTSEGQNRQSLLYHLQSMRMSQAELYRDDLRSMFSSVDQKMQSLVLVASILLGVAFNLLLSSSIYENDYPMWTVLYLGTHVCSSLLHLALALYFSVYSSIAAVAAMVRVLTQEVRIPIPNLDDIKYGMSYASDFEQPRNVHEALRIPFLMQTGGRRQYMGEGWPELLARRIFGVQSGEDTEDGVYRRFLRLIGSDPQAASDTGKQVDGKFVTVAKDRYVDTSPLGRAAMDGMAGIHAGHHEFTAAELCHMSGRVGGAGASSGGAGMMMKNGRSYGGSSAMAGAASDPSGGIGDRIVVNNGEQGRISAGSSNRVRFSAAADQHERSGELRKLNLVKPSRKHTKRGVKGMLMTGETFNFGHEEIFASDDEDRARDQQHLQESKNANDHLSKAVEIRKERKDAAIRHWGRIVRHKLRMHYFQTGSAVDNYNCDLDSFMSSSSTSSSSLRSSRDETNGASPGGTSSRPGGSRSKKSRSGPSRRQRKDASLAAPRVRVHSRMVEFLPEDHMKPPEQDIANCFHFRHYHDFDKRWGAFQKLARICLALGTSSLFSSLSAFVLMSVVYSRRLFFPGFLFIFILTIVQICIQKVEVASKLPLRLDACLALESLIAWTIVVLIDVSGEYERFVPLVFFVRLVYLRELIKLTPFLGSGRSFEHFRSARFAEYMTASTHVLNSEKEAAMAHLDKAEADVGAQHAHAEVVEEAARRASSKGKTGAGENGKNQDVGSSSANNMLITSSPAARNELHQLGALAERKRPKSTTELNYALPVRSLAAMNRQSQLRNRDSQEMRYLEQLEEEQEREGPGGPRGVFPGSYALEVRVQRLLNLFEHAYTLIQMDDARIGAVQACRRTFDKSRRQLSKRFPDALRPDLTVADGANAEFDGKRYLDGGAAVGGGSAGVATLPYGGTMTSRPANDLFSIEAAEDRRSKLVGDAVSRMFSTGGHQMREGSHQLASKNTSTEDDEEEEEGAIQIHISAPGSSSDDDSSSAPAVDHAEHSDSSGNQSAAYRNRSGSSAGAASSRSSRRNQSPSSSSEDDKHSSSKASSDQEGLEQRRRPARGRGARGEGSTAELRDSPSLVAALDALNSYTTPSPGATGDVGGYSSYGTSYGGYGYGASSSAVPTYSSGYDTVGAGATTSGGVFGANHDVKQTAAGGASTSSEMAENKPRRPWTTSSIIPPDDAWVELYYNGSRGLHLPYYVNPVLMTNSWTRPENVPNETEYHIPTLLTLQVDTRLFHLGVKDAVAALVLKEGRDGEEEGEDGGKHGRSTIDTKQAGTKQAEGEQLQTEVDEQGNVENLASQEEEGEDEAENVNDIHDTSGASDHNSEDENSPSVQEEERQEIEKESSTSDVATGKDNEQQVDEEQEDKLADDAITREGSRDNTNMAALPAAPTSTTTTTNMKPVESSEADDDSDDSDDDMVFDVLQGEAVAARVGAQTERPSRKVMGGGNYEGAHKAERVGGGLKRGLVRGIDASEQDDRERESTETESEVLSQQDEGLRETQLASPTGGRQSMHLNGRKNNTKLKQRIGGLLHRVLQDMSNAKKSGTSTSKKNDASKGGPFSSNSDDEVGGSDDDMFPTAQGGGRGRPNNENYTKTKGAEPGSGRAGSQSQHHVTPLPGRLFRLSTASIFACWSLGFLWCILVYSIFLERKLVSKPGGEGFGSSTSSLNLGSPLRRKLGRGGVEEEDIHQDRQQREVVHVDEEVEDESYWCPDSTLVCRFLLRVFNKNIATPRGRQLQHIVHNINYQQQQGSLTATTSSPQHHVYGVNNQHPGNTSPSNYPLRNSANSKKQITSPALLQEAHQQHRVETLAVILCDRMSAKRCAAKQIRPISRKLRSDVDFEEDGLISMAEIRRYLEIVNEDGTEADEDDVRIWNFAIELQRFVQDHEEITPAEQKN
ncbi:unnamed protein product [Amoebophrya sp. A25]|nr:unnamed protein product [Amoebophrya sp. A25]|eukprot:GSA25T00017305001.1